LSWPHLPWALVLTLAMARDYFGVFDSVTLASDSVSFFQARVHLCPCPRTCTELSGVGQHRYYASHRCDRTKAMTTNLTE